MPESVIQGEILAAVEKHDSDDEPGSPIGDVVQEVLEENHAHFADVSDEFQELFFHGVLYQPSHSTVASTWIGVEDVGDDRGESTEKLPWCPECEAFAVPDEDGVCGDCEAAIEYREVPA